MKIKTIRAILKRKFNEWTKSIPEENGFRNEVKNNSIITGGCIASMLLQEKVNDFDIYFTNIETAKRVAEYYIGIFLQTNREKLINNNMPLDIKLVEVKDGMKLKIKSVGIMSETIDKRYQYFEGTDPDSLDTNEFVDFATDLFKEEEDKPNYRPIFISANAITLSNKIQLVTRFCGSPGKIHENFDFVHCTSYWTSKDEKLVLNQQALESLMTKNLHYIGSKYPLTSIIRTRKFIKRGFSVNAGQYLKMCYQISDLDLSDILVLEEQLTGVDFAYFYHLIEGLKAQKDKDPNFKPNYEYIVAIVDKIF